MEMRSSFVLIGFKSHLSINPCVNWLLILHIMLTPFALNLIFRINVRFFYVIDGPVALYALKLHILVFSPHVCSFRCIA